MPAITHTPGPWVIAPLVANHGAHTCIQTAEADTLAVIPSRAWDIKATDVETVTDRANARLMRAAPEMLAALLAIEEWWMREGIQKHDGAPSAIFEARAAIAKAAA